MSFLNKFKLLQAFPLLMVILLDVAGVILVMPILTPLILNAHSGMLPESASPFARDFLYGLSLSLYPLFMFFSTPILGDLSDRFGRKKILQTCLMGTMLSYLMAAVGIITNQLTLVLISRAIAGLAAGTQPIATAAIIDLSTPKNKTRYLSWVVFMTSLGFIIGPMVGGLSADAHLSRWFTYQTPFFITAAFALTVSLLLQWTYTETAPKKTQQSIQLTKGFTLFIAAFAERNFRFVSALFFCFILAWGLYYQTINWFFMEKFQYTVGQMGLFVSFIGIIFAITSSTVSKYVLRLFKSEQQAFAFFIFTMGIGAIGSALSTSELAQWCWVIVIAMSDVICYILSFSLFSSLVDKNAQGWAMGVMSALSAFTWTFGGLIAGPLGYAALQLPTFIAGILCLISFIIMMLYQTEKTAVALSEETAS
jgi:DHA1 family tetracycline resistance protein-like MFS transporter